jgi:hypothetical protein
MPHQTSHRIDLADQPQGPQPGRHQDDGARGDGEDGDDGGGQRAEGNKRDRTLIGALLLGDHQGSEKYETPEQRAHREEDQAKVEIRRRLHRHVGGEHDARFALQHGDRREQGAAQHEHIPEPRHLGRGQAAVEDDGRCEVEHRDLEEDDPEQQHRRAVSGEHEIEQLGRQQVHGRPAGQRHEDAEESILISVSAFS